MNHTLPDRIVVYRDGVGDGQLRTVAGYEVQQLSECFSLFGESYEPKMAVVIVSKRINARIFATQVSSLLCKQELTFPFFGFMLSRLGSIATSF